MRSAVASNNPRAGLIIGVVAWQIGPSGEFAELDVVEVVGDDDVAHVDPIAACDSTGYSADQNDLGPEIL